MKPLLCLLTLLPLTGLSADNLRLTLAELSWPNCVVSWEFEQARIKEIEGFRLVLVDPEGQEIAHTLSPSYRDYPCADLDIKTVGNYSLYALSYQGDTDSEPSNRVDFTAIYQAPLPVPGRLMLTLEPWVD